jgi:hypothetical protein
MEGLMKMKNRYLFTFLLFFLNLACNAGHYEIVELLIKYKANVNIQSTSGNTALHYAAGGVREKIEKKGILSTFFCVI